MKNGAIPILVVVLALIAFAGVGYLVLSSDGEAESSAFTVDDSDAQARKRSDQDASNANSDTKVIERKDKDANADSEADVAAKSPEESATDDSSDSGGAEAPSTDSAASATNTGEVTRAIEDDESTPEEKPSESFTTTISGKVVNAEGEPVSGATVKAVDIIARHRESNPDSASAVGELIRTASRYAISNTNAARQLPQEVKGETTTAPDGTFTIEVSGLHFADAEDVKVSVEASADGYRSQESKALSINKGEHANIEIKLIIPGIVYGFVYEEGSSTPIADVEVKLSPDWMKNRGNSGSRTIRSSFSTGSNPFARGSTITDESGAFRIEDVEPGHYFIEAKHKNNAAGNAVGAVLVRSIMVGNASEEQLPPSRARVEIKSGEESGPINLRLARPSAVTFTLSNGDVKDVRVNLSEKPSSGDGIMTTIMNIGGSSGTPVSPDATGLYTVNGLTTKHNKIEIWAKGFMRTTREIDPVEGQSIALGMITLQKGATVRGVLLDKEGGVIANKVVFLEKLNNPTTGGIRIQGLGRFGSENTSTDASGEFSFSGLAAGKYKINCNNIEGYSDKSVDFAVDETLGDPTYLRIELSSGGSISGIITLPAGAAEKEEPANPAGFVTMGRRQVSLVPESNDNSGMGGFGFSGFSRYRSKINDDGSYKISNVTPGTYKLVVTYDGASREIPGVVIVEGQETIRNTSLE